MTREAGRTPRDLITLARACGVQTSYRSVLTGRTVAASRPALQGVLRALGVEVGSDTDLRAAVRETGREAVRHPAEPVAVAWDGILPPLRLRLPANLATGTLRARLRLEDGTERLQRLRLDDLATDGVVEVGRERFVVRLLHLREVLPAGYHRLELEGPGWRSRSLIISSPVRPAARPLPARAWGVFLPLYALPASRSCGVAGFPDLARAAEWARREGAAVVATLPLLATFLDEPADPSPYRPVSRLFWNELHLDPGSIDALGGCAAARRLLASPAFRRRAREMGDAALLDPPAAAALKRPVLEALARHELGGGARPAGFHRWRAERPRADEYARFRATGERLRLPWPRWPAPLRDGTLPAGTYREEDRLYHLYVQWRSDEQLAAAAARGGGLLLDFPLGVHPDGYDAWRHPGLFAFGATAGAPPDRYSRRGQSWGFPPLHPRRLREDGYGYLRAALAAHLRHARVLRIDHVMWLFRLYWVPDGLGADDGAYVRYPAEEILAVLALEAARAGAVLVGEDLGTVPAAVRPALRRHGMLRTFVAQRELMAHGGDTLARIPAACLAAVNTHDHPTFAGFLAGADLDDRVALGFAPPEERDAERRRRARQLRGLRATLRRARHLPRGDRPADLYPALAAGLAASPSRLVLLNLEDLWGERRPQNVPGTVTERPNWRRRMRHGIDDLPRLRRVRGILSAVRQGRREPGT